jgi:hypothetical protein
MQSKRLLARYLVLLCAAAVGCQQATRPVVVDPAVSQDQLPLVDNPQYTHWKQFPVGTKVVRYKEVTNENGTVYVTTTYEVTEISDERIIVSQQISVQRPEEFIENPPQDLEFVAQFRLHKDLQVEDFALPSLKAKRVGTETQECCGRMEETELFEWVETNEAGPMDVKLWRSNNIPGQLVRQESIIRRNGDSSFETVLSIDVPEK